MRVRLQAQHPTSPAHAPQNLTNTISSLRAQKFPLSFNHATTVNPELGVTACCREVFWVNNTAEACFASSALTDSCVVEQTARRRFEGTWEGLVKIARYEGVSSLWRGLSPTLLMAVPANVIYFTGYDYLRSSGSSPFASLGPTLAPLLAGSAARAIAATVISPLEMFKTRLQATSTHTHSSGAFKETLQGITRMVSTEGPLTLWRGLELTLWRDVPFSGVYWFGYEVIKDALRLRRERQSALMHNDIFARASEQRKEELHGEATFADSFVAGASSGAVAAFITTPFDVGKTRRQIAHSKGVDGPGSMPKVLMEIWREGGVRSLWKGCTPRMLKVAPACAIMVGHTPLRLVRTITDICADLEL